MASCTAISTKVETNTSIVTYKYTWKINNFLKYYDVLRGPEFSPLKSTPLRFVVELEPHIERDDGDYDYKFNLIKVSKEEVTKSCRVEFAIILGNCLNGHQHSSNNVNKSITVFDLDHICLLKTVLKNTGLYIGDKSMPVYTNVSFDSTFTFFGFNETTASNTDPILRTPLERYSAICNGFKDLYGTKTKCDIRFEIGDEVLQAHQCVLMAQSPVFKRMFENDLTETNSNCVRITDFDADVFNCFLKYLYCGDADYKKCDILPHLFALADKYEVQSLMKDCSEVLATGLTKETVVQILMVAHLHSCDLLKEKCIHFIHRDFSLVKNSPEWKNFLEDKTEFSYEILNSVLAKF